MLINNNSGGPYACWLPNSIKLFTLYTLGSQNTQKLRDKRVLKKIEISH